MKVMTDKQYLARKGGSCPVCHSRNIEADSVEAEGLEAWCDVKCNSCGSRWVDTFKLTGFDLSYNGRTGETFND